MTRNEAYARSLGLPYVKESERPPLAVVGGGHSILENVAELQSWAGDVWAIGSAFQWCRSQGIKATFFCVDPQPGAELVIGAEHAIVATCTDPGVLRALQAIGARVEIFDLVATLERCNHGPTSATAVPELAVPDMGYRSVTFFGCESSYGGTTHAYKDHAEPCRIWVQCNGEEFETGAEFLMQAECLAHVLRALPQFFNERSGGLLRALTATPDYDITHVSRKVYRELFQKEPA
jgi:hypothetical protein